MAVTIEQALATLRARVARERAEWEATAETTRTLLRQRLPGALPAGTVAWLIGSLAWGGYGPHSDVDLVVRGCTSLQACQIERNLTEALQVPVEVLRFEELPMTFRNRIEREGVQLHGS